jgi:hypothetical protein
MTTTDQLPFDKSWAESLLPEFDKDYMKSLKVFLREFFLTHLCGLMR